VNVDVVRDVLDTLVVDRNGREMGRVDAIVLDIEAGHPPRLAAILIGPVALASRLHPALGRLAAAIEAAFGLGRDRPVRVGFRDLDVEHMMRIKVRLTIGDTAAEAVEQRLRKWIQTIPGSR
jgi:hypothetical protein